MGLNVSFTRDWFSAYISYVDAKLDMPLAPADQFSGLVTAAGGTQEQANLLRADGDHATFFGKGFTVDYDDVVLRGEWSSWRAEDSYLDEPTRAWYVTAGYRFGQFLPYVQYEQNEAGLSEGITSQLPNVVLPAQAGVFGGLLLPVAAQGLLNNIKRDDYTITSVGMRYDFHPSATLKIQLSDREDKLNDALSARLATVGIDLIF